MQGHAQQRTLEAMALDPSVEELYGRIVNKDGEPRVLDDVRVSAIGSSDGEKVGALTVGVGPERGGPKLGPELAFGATMHEHLGEPVLLIKTAWGGKSLHTDFRSPGAGPSPIPEARLAAAEKKGEDLDALRAAHAEATGRFYRLMIDHVRSVMEDPGRVHPGYSKRRGAELAGFVWFQGWNDVVDRGVYPERDRKGGYGAYSECMAHFIRDVRKDLGAPDLPFVIGVLGVGGPVAEYAPDQKRYAGVHQNFRDAMAAPASMPEFEGNVVAVLTERCWDQQLTALRRREGKLRPEFKKIDERRKSGALSGADAKAARQALRDEHFSPEEQHLLDTGVSNAEFHYLGSAKILSRIGEEFANAMVETMGSKER